MAGDTALEAQCRFVCRGMRFDTQVSIKIKDAYAARAEPEAVRFLGSVYWASIITFFTLVVAASIAFGIWEFMQPLSNTPDTIVGAHPQKTLTKSDLGKILDGFDARAKKYNTRKIAPVLVRDPS